MTDPTPVHFFDITCTLPGPSQSWSPNTLKTRMVLNYKNLPYTQSFISYPDIAPLLRDAAITPHTQGTPFTLPAIRHPSVTANPHGFLMDSFAIATHLDQTFPARPLFPSGDASYALALAVTQLLRAISTHCATLVIPNVADVLDPRGRDYFIETRTTRFGKPLSDVRPKDDTTVRALMDAACTDMVPLVQMLRGRPGKKGPFFEGETPSYADFLLVSFLAWPERADKVLFEQLVGVDPAVRDLWDACLPWLNGQGEEIKWEIPR